MEGCEIGYFLLGVLIKSFISKTEIPSRGNSSNLDVSESVWTIEASLNYKHAKLDKKVIEFLSVKDSIQVILEPNQILSENDCISLFNHFDNIIQNLKENDSLFVCRIVDLDYRDNYLFVEIIFGELDPESGTRDVSDPYFLPGESYYAYTSAYYYPNPIPAPLPGPFNATKFIQTKLRFRNEILYLPAGSYFTGVTAWQPQGSGGFVSPIDNYYAEFCKSNTQKLWGTPGHDAVYKGHVENAMLSYTYLNFILDEADNFINYTSPPSGKQVSHIEYKATHAGEVLNPDDFTPCLGSYEFFYYFRWKYGTLVYPME